MLAWAMSDRTIPRNFRAMQGFGVHTFLFVNAAGERTFVKFHWKPKLGLQGMAWDESLKLNGIDPDFQRRDLYDNISKGNFPQWELGVQCVKEADEESFDFDIRKGQHRVASEQEAVHALHPRKSNRLDSFDCCIVLCRSVLVLLVSGSHKDHP